MQRLIVLGLAAMLMLPASAARRITVAQLGQTLAAALAAHRSDADLSHVLRGMELSERLTNATLDEFAAKLALQPRTALALQLLAAQSALLDPPAAELPATEKPDLPAQKKMLDAARGYVLQTVPHLPNFFATRTTNRFDDSPQVLAKGDWPVRDGLHLVGTATRKITFRDGKEVQDTETDLAKSGPGASQELGLNTWGEFGPELAIVLADTARGNISWSHWEQTPTGLAAVFHYEVPRTASHYAVNYCCLLDEQYVERRRMGYGGGSSGIGGTHGNNLNKTVSAHTYSETPGYHGTLSIDPVTGAVLRITLEAELKSGDPLLRAATVVEYGPVSIGDRTYVCPQRSLAFSMEEASLANTTQVSASIIGSNHATDEAWGSTVTPRSNTPVLLVNETAFGDYHRLGSSMRVLPEAATADSSSGAAPDAIAAAHSGAASLPSSGPSTSMTEPGPAPAKAEAAPPEMAQPVHSEVAAPVPGPAIIPEISMSTAKAVPDVPADNTASQDGGFSIKVTTRLVDIGVVAYDRKGRPVTDLKAEDFEIYDNGHKQEVRFFSPAEGMGASVVAPANSSAPVAGSPVQTFSNRMPDAVPSPGATATPETGATILLIDESHISWPDMNNARTHMVKFLQSVAPSERIGLYTMNDLGFHVLVEATTDHAALIARMQKFMPTAQSVSQAQEDETRNRQQINEVHNVADLESVNGNRIDAADSAQPVDPQLLTLGSNPARASLLILAQVARHLSSIIGHKNLVWVSSDNVFADWQDQAVGIDKSPGDADRYALHVQEAMNEAHAAIYPFDVSQLEAGAISADMQHRNVELTPAAADNAATAAAATGASAPPNGRNMQPGRIIAQMNQDLHPIQEPIREVAAATGGRTIRRSGDLAAALTSIVDDGRATYILSFTPQGPADDQYHSLTVKPVRHGLTLRYRTGYLFAREPATLKERFQQAVWKPTDMSEIAVTADVDAFGGGASVKVNIAASDLSLQQQADRWMDKLDIFFIQRDDTGLHANLEGQTLGLRLKPSTYQTLLAKGVPFEHSIQKRPGMSSLRVLVVDENSGRMGSVTVPALAMESTR